LATVHGAAIISESDINVTDGMNPILSRDRRERFPSGPAPRR
jgi:hypothetical protein